MQDQRDRTEQLLELAGKFIGFGSLSTSTRLGSVHHSARVKVVVASFTQPSAV